MGAYDNPRLIQPVNYAEIFNRSTQNIVNAFNRYEAGERKKEEEADKIIAQSGKKVTDFGAEVTTATEGTLLGSVTNVSQEMTAQYAELERLRIRGELSNSDYAAQTASLYKNIGEMKAYNAGLAAFEDTIKETGDNLSAYQEEAGATMAVLEAKKSGTLNILFKNGELVSQMPGPDGKPIPFSPKTLTEAKNLIVNEKLDAAADVQTGVDLLTKLKVKTSNSYTYKDDSGSTSTKAMEEWANPQYETEEKRIEYLMTNSASPISGIDSLEAGSFIVDNKLKSGVKLENDPLFNEVLAKTDYPPEVQNAILNSVANGKFSKEVVVEGKSGDPVVVPITDFSITYAKKAMATDAVAQAGDLAQKQVSVVVDKTTGTSDKPDQYSRSVGQAKADARSIIDALLKDRGSFIREVYGTTEVESEKIAPGEGEDIGRDLIKVPTEDGGFETYDFSRKEDILNLANSIATQRYRPGKLTGIFQDEMKKYLLERRKSRPKTEAEKARKKRLKEAANKIN